MGNNYTVIYNPQVIRERENRLPMGIAILVLCVIGIVGNSLVLHIVRKIQLNSAYTIFVFTLALLDLNTSIAHLCKEINNLVYVTYDDAEIECKLSYYAGFLAGCSSFNMVCVIAWERYRKICHPLKPQMTVATAKRICVACLLLSSVLGVPFPFIMGNWHKKLEGQDTVNCLLANNDEPKVWPFIYLLAYWVEVVVWCFICAGLQITIWRRILTQQLSRKKMKLGKQFSEKPRSNTTKQTDLHSSNSIPIEKIETPCTSHQKNVQNEAKKEIYTLEAKNVKDHIKKPPSKQTKISKRSTEEDNVKITLTFCIITLLLVISYLPHLAFYTYVAYENYYDPKETITRSNYILYSLLPDFVAVNGILNPFVYFLNDKRFRDFLKQMFNSK